MNLDRNKLDGQYLGLGLELALKNACDWLVPVVSISVYAAAKSFGPQVFAGVDTQEFLLASRFVHSVIVKLRDLVFVLSFQIAVCSL